MLAIYFIIICGINARTSQIPFVWAKLKGLIFLRSFDWCRHNATHIFVKYYICVGPKYFWTERLTVIDKFLLIRCTIEQYQLNECNNLWDFFRIIFTHIRHATWYTHTWHAQISLHPFAFTSTYSSAICVYDVLFDIFKVQVSTFWVCLITESRCTLPLPMRTLLFLHRAYTF